MRYFDDPQIHEQGNRGKVNEACAEAADELLYKLSILKRERTTLVNMVNNRLKANLPLTSLEISEQAEKINRILQDEAIAGLFGFLHASEWEQNRLDERKFRQQTLILESPTPYDKRCVTAAREEMDVFFTAPICCLIQPRIGGTL